MMRFLIVIFAALSLNLTSPVISAQAENPPNISEAEIEKRAKDIGYSLRCVVCKNESIEESPASTAQDMRRIVRDRIRKGQSDQEIIDFMQSRYGDFILLKPPLQPNTYLLWGLPFILLAGAFLWFWRASRKFNAQFDENP